MLKVAEGKGEKEEGIVEKRRKGRRWKGDKKKSRCQRERKKSKWQSGSNKKGKHYLRLTRKMRITSVNTDKE